MKEFNKSLHMIQEVYKVSLIKIMHIFNFIRSYKVKPE